MDINDLRALSTVLMFVTFLGIVWWALAGRRDRFEDAARLPFADEPDHAPSRDSATKAPTQQQENNS